MFHVKHSGQASRRVDWESAAARHGLCLDAGQRQQLQSLAEWVAERGSRLGLTHYATAEEVALHAILPTFALFGLRKPCAGELVLDLGAGSGVLGFTLAVLAPQVRVVLADRRRRSARFLGLTQARLGLENAEGREVSAQELAKVERRGFGLVCVRALAPGEVTLALAQPLVAPEGALAVWHQSQDPAYLYPSSPWQRQATAETDLPLLSVSIYMIAGGEQAAGRAAVPTPRPEVGA